MSTPNGVNAHGVGTQGVSHQVDFREFCLKGRHKGQALIHTKKHLHWMEAGMTISKSA